MDTLQINEVHTVPIDDTGVLAIFNVGGSPAYSQTIGLNLEGIDDAEAAYAVDLGGRDRESGDIEWFEDEIEYEQTESVRDAWVQAEQYVRLRVTTAAPTDSEARLYVARGA